MVALPVERYLSNAALSILSAVYSVKDHQNLLHYSLVLKKACIGHVVFDEWFPLTLRTAAVSCRARCCGRFARARSARSMGSTRTQQCPCFAAVLLQGVECRVRAACDVRIAAYDGRNCVNTEHSLRYARSPPTARVSGVLCRGYRCLRPLHESKLAGS